MSEAPPTKPNQCAATRTNGQPCAGQALPGSAFCFAHDPERATQRDEARRKGGQNRSNIVRMRSLLPPRLVPVFDQLATALGEVHEGELDPKAGQAMASIARAMVAVMTAGELEERVRSLEERRSA